VCANCVQCEEHHSQNLLWCGFEKPKSVAFRAIDQVVEDDDPLLNGRPFVDKSEDEDNA
jgi:hypothetical protein